MRTAFQVFEYAYQHQGIIGINPERELVVTSMESVQREAFKFARAPHRCAASPDRGVINLTDLIDIVLQRRVELRCSTQQTCIHLAHFSSMRSFSRRAST